MQGAGTERAMLLRGERMVAAAAGPGQAIPSLPGEYKRLKQEAKLFNRLMI
jgi:hypothetical protein